MVSSLHARQHKCLKWKESLALNQFCHFYDTQLMEMKSKCAHIHTRGHMVATQTDAQFVDIAIEAYNVWHVAFKYDQFTLGAKFQCACACVYMWSLRAINYRNIHNSHAKRHTESHTIRDNNTCTRTLQIHLGFQFLSGMAVHLREIPLYLKRLVGRQCLGQYCVAYIYRGQSKKKSIQSI